jgi:hypothetical protein
MNRTQWIWWLREAPEAGRWRMRGFGRAGGTQFGGIPGKRLVLVPHICDRKCPCCLEPCIIAETDTSGEAPCVTAEHHLF